MEEVAKAVGGGYCRLRMPLKRLNVRSPDPIRNPQLFKENTPSVVYVTNLATVGTLNSDFMLNLTEIPRGAGSGFVWCAPCMSDRGGGGEGGRRGRCKPAVEQIIGFMKDGLSIPNGEGVHPPFSAFRTESRTRHERSPTRRCGIRSRPVIPLN